MFGAPELLRHFEFALAVRLSRYFATKNHYAAQRKEKGGPG
jgi:hypothetical protein